jgi:hypothetical protein
VSQVIIWFLYLHGIFRKGLVLVFGERVGIEKFLVNLAGILVNWSKTLIFRCFLRVGQFFAETFRVGLLCRNYGGVEETFRVGLLCRNYGGVVGMVRVGLLCRNYGGVVGMVRVSLLCRNYGVVVGMVRVGLLCRNYVGVRKILLSRKISLL